jgi:hypothetical protein
MNLGLYIDREISENASKIANSIKIDEVTRLSDIYWKILIQDRFVNEEDKFRTKLETHLRREVQSVIGEVMQTWSSNNLKTVLNPEIDAAGRRLRTLIGEYIQEREAIQSGDDSVNTLSQRELEDRIEKITKSIRTGGIVARGEQWVDLGPLIGGIIAEIVAEAVLHKVMAGVTLGVSLIVSYLLAVWRQGRFRDKIREEIARGLRDNVEVLKLTMKDAVREKVTSAMREIADRLGQTMNKEIELIRANKSATLSRLQAENFKLSELKDELDKFVSQVSNEVARIDQILLTPVSSFSSVTA